MLNIDSKVSDFLEQLNLSKTEQQLFLVGLTVPEASVTELIDKTGINRTTAYHALGTLQQKGLASEVKLQGKLVYTMKSPEDLRNVLSRQASTIEKQKHELDSIANLFPTAVGDSMSTHIEKFEGIENVKNAVEKALYCNSRKWEIIAPKDNFFSQVEPEYAEYFMKTRKSHDIQSRSLWEKTFRTSANLTLEELLMRKPRYLTDEFTGKFKSVIIIFDNKALFITSAEKQNAILVDSDEISGTLRVLFEALWKLSDKPD